MIEHANTVNFLHWSSEEFGSESLRHTAFCTSINFDLSIFELFAPLIRGGTVHVLQDLRALIGRESEELTLAQHGALGAERSTGGRRAFAQHALSESCR